MQLLLVLMDLEAIGDGLHHLPSVIGPILATLSILTLNEPRAHSIADLRLASQINPLSQIVGKCATACSALRLQSRRLIVWF